MRLSRIVFLGGLSSLMLSSIAFWQRSNATSRHESYLTAWAAQPAPTSPPVAVAPATFVQPAPISPAPPVAPAVPTTSPFSAAQASLRTIATCNGLSGNANFRSIPSLAPGAVLGVVAQDETVALTGRTAIGDGEFWYEAIASTLSPSLDPTAQNRLEPNQVGWIASCFVEG